MPKVVSKPCDSEGNQKGTNLNDVCALISISVSRKRTNGVFSDSEIELLNKKKKIKRNFNVSKYINISSTDDENEVQIVAKIPAKRRRKIQKRKVKVQQLSDDDDVTVVDFEGPKVHMSKEVEVTEVVPARSVEFVDVLKRQKDDSQVIQNHDDSETDSAEDIYQNQLMDPKVRAMYDAQLDSLFYFK